MSAALTLPAVAWRWQWVPASDAPEADAAAWLTSTADVFTGWARDGLTDATALPPEVRAEVTPEGVGRVVALWLWGRAGECPPGARLVWGAAFTSADRPRWAPVLVTVEFRVPLADDPSYLMDDVGARGADDDARPAVVDYVTTAAGDGLRVGALVREPYGAAAFRVDAAVRIDVPAHDDSGATAVDVLLATRVQDLGLAGVVGPGVEELMHLVAEQFLPGPDGTTGIVLAPAERSMP
ncbi:hypothetical protein [Cellulomonas sp. S1-8]|uniref:hypothetical protein n=1 Tax=Cellulomonas sp. S1-8 TaxID=2904790 RepID=UPI0022443C11|nr:hypothetical protein [Cellulomonas sp. S1-8]UZN03124.1 hypothetical protein OKX07_19055 [Cellulomonas sp. S1-8]